MKTLLWLTAIIALWALIALIIKRKSSSKRIVIGGGFLGMVFVIPVVAATANFIYELTPEYHAEIEQKHQKEAERKAAKLLNEQARERVQRLAEEKQKILTQDQQFKEKEKNERTEKIKRQFSSRDGSHRNLERFIKKSMHDPDSYDHVETVYSDRGDYLVVTTTFRGKNAFNAIIKDSLTAIVSLDGDIMEILDE